MASVIKNPKDIPPARHIKIGMNKRPVLRNAGIDNIPGIINKDSKDNTFLFFITEF